ncbi:hypothetical protein E1288_30120 [Saccharopolyspora elongata]|uniref:Hydantoinase B/oxoprolinase domain-containing protein n=1 Tax=Saccharopolyspora elongata TaxID=2530387 RepID=A0A4R4YC10_9PSEU|nr:hypothetical protein E1288_30120 [Saccharopolyspora elongata]
MVFFMDHCGGAGGGAQSSFDGLDLYGMTISPGIGLPSIEVNESTQPALYLGRTLNANSGGPGVHSGGLSMESARAVYGSDRQRLPPRLPEPGALSTTRTSTKCWPRGTIRSRRCCMATNRSDRRTKEVSRCRAATCCGCAAVVGRPRRSVVAAGRRCRRRPARLLHHTEAVYGVVLDDHGDVDEAATARERALIRKHRIGREPTRAQDEPETVGVSLTVANGAQGRVWCCAYCAESLCSVDDSWRVKESRLRRKASARAIPCTFLGKHLRFSDDDLIEIIRRGRAPSADPARSA